MLLGIVGCVYFFNEDLFIKNNFIFFEREYLGFLLLLIESP